MTSSRAVVLASGGLDSTTVLALAREGGHEITALTFSYGQRHEVEVQRAREAVASLGVTDHVVLSLPLQAIGGSALVGEGEIPDEIPGQTGVRVPVTYVPARNLIFLALAVGLAEARGARDLYIGVNAIDYSGYPDCRPGFIAALTRAANLGTREGAASSEPWFRIHAPLVEWGKAAIIREGIRLGVDYSRTVSCYRADGDGRACGGCEACGLRRRGFEEAGLPDPTRYR